MDKKKITFADIAKYTNFSKTTISRYFNNPDSLTIESQEIIAKALSDLNYQENKLAKVFANGKSEFVGIIVPNLYLHYYAEMLNQILDTYEDFGYKFLIFTSRSGEKAERKYIQELLSYKIEGMIILSHTIPSKELASCNIPIVGIEREDQYINSISTDNYMGAVQGTSLLIRSHCDVLVHINSKVPENVPAYGRILGFQDTCTQNQIPIGTATIGDALKFVKENEMVKICSYNGEVFAVEPPLFVELAIAETEPGVKGDTATGATKPATVETGATVYVPLFVNQGDTIKIDTRTGEYLSRV